MKDLVQKAGLASEFHIESAATSREEIGNPVYPPARRKLAEHGISCEGHAARQLTNRDYDEYDLLIGMDQANLRDMYRICGGDYAEKMSLLMDHTARPGNVADPWYTEDFEATWQDVLGRCQGRTVCHQRTGYGWRFGSCGLFCISGTVENTIYRIYNAMTMCYFGRC